MMKKAAPRSESENTHNFDSDKFEYVPLDRDAWLAEHRVREEGERRGKLNQPGPNESLPDEMYRKIESYINEQARDCKDKVGKYITKELASLHDISSSWHEQNPEIGLDARVAQRCQDLHAKADRNVSDLDKQRAEYEEAAKDLKKFRELNNLSQVAHYPSSQFAHWLWVPVAMILETFLSANLLGSVSRGGIIEGWVVALVLTFVNVLLGVLAGGVWRFTQYGWGFMRLFAYIFGMLCVALVLLWNGMAGHVRDVYVRAEKTKEFGSLDEAFATAWNTMIGQPLPWESLPSAGLALVGVAVFALTAFKSYTADDPFPGYGARHRKVEALHGRYQDDLNDALDELGAIRNSANEDIDEIKSRYEMDRAVWESTLDRLRRVVSDYTTNLKQYNKDLAYLLAAYRDANLATRKAAPPPFFGNEPTIDEDLLKPPEFAIPDQPEWGDIPTKAEEGFARVEETYAELRPHHRMLDRVVDDYTERELMK